jgi:hypothetical protein
MTTAAIAGLLALATPLILGGLVILRGKGRPLGFYMALIAVGLGYLFATGALDDIGTKVLEMIGTATAEKSPEAAPAN